LKLIVPCTSAVLGLGLAVCAQRSPLDRAAMMVSSPSTRLPVVKRAPRPSAGYPGSADYMRILERFPALLARGWRSPETTGHPVGFFGDPDHAEMGMRSMGNCVFVLALLATDPAYDERVTGRSRGYVLARARDCLAYMTRGHVTGNLTCADGRKWGDHWQSAWWAAKMAVGAHLMWAHLTENERTAVERVLSHEADRHLARRAPGGALRNTRSEENAWDTEVLAAACAYLPGHANAGSWRRKLVEFALNSLSAPQDQLSPEVVDGRPLRDQVYTANVHADFTIENHGAYHTCYMACPLHSLAWGYYALESAGQPVPEAQFHHFRDVWLIMKPTFLGRRFAYPGGKDWPRYAYGMAFIMPALVALQYRYGDTEARVIEAQRVRCFEEEQLHNADGSFFGRRFTRNVMMDRMAEYETDTYANLGLGYLLHKRLGPPAPTPSVAHMDAGLRDAHASPEAGLAFVRGTRAFASVAWRRLDGPYPCAYFVPLAADDLAEWGPNNLLGRIVVDGVDPAKTVTESREHAAAGKLDCSATIRYHGKDGGPLYVHHVKVRADCDDGWATVDTRFVAESAITVRSREGLRLHVANDVFNGYRRTWRHQAAPFVELFAPPPVSPARETLNEVRLDGPCVSVDGRLGIADLDGNGGFALRISDRSNGPWGSIHYSVLDCPPLDQRAATANAGEVILSGRFAAVAGDIRRTRALAARLSAADRSARPSR